MIKLTPLLSPLDSRKIDFFQSQLINWFDENGRHDLPWKPSLDFDLSTNLYRIWLSEIMLQQTQVITVIQYFEKFTQRFPRLEDLANAPIDDVLALWAGLGYYSRARNLHACAQQIMDDFSGNWPRDLTLMMTLKGIGRTTSAAILSQGFNLPTAIVDGNVKRVLSRFLGCNAPAQSLEKAITPYAELLMHQTRCADYTQAIMDFGAAICTKVPKCHICKMQSECYAYRANAVNVLPTPKLKKTKPVVHTIFCIIQNDKGEIFLAKRPDKGIWGGLWCVPELPHSAEIVTKWLHASGDVIADDLLKDSDVLKVLEKYAGKLGLSDVLPTFKHHFTHYTLIGYPIVFDFVVENNNKLVGCTDHWHNAPLIQQKGLPKPISVLLNKYLNVCV